jgi:hypothetical protein
MPLIPVAQACPGESSISARFNSSRLAALGAAAMIRPELPQGDQENQGNGDGGFVGMWEVTLTSGGSIYDHAFQQLYSDGNEIQNSGLVPPAEGAICFGVWARDQNGAVKLKHYGWTFDLAGNFTGTFVLSATIKLTSHDAYKGTFVADIILPNGQKDPGQHVTGTITGHRISVD